MNTLALTPKQLGRFWAKVRKTETCWNWVAAKYPTGYGHLTLNYKSHYPHRISFMLSKGAIPPGMQIDHRCHNVACVNPDHLRLATSKENMENIRAHRHGSSGVRGVSFHKVSGKWTARVTHNGRKIYLGLYPTIAEAEAVAIAKRNELYTHNDLDREAAA